MLGPIINYSSLTNAEITWVQEGSAGNIRLAEVSAPTGTASGRGLLYVRSSDSKLYYQDDSGVETDLTAAGGGAPTNATYVTMSLNGTLSAERVLTGTNNQITITDGGANGNVTLSTPQDLHSTAIITFGTVTVANGLSAGTAHVTGTTVLATSSGFVGIGTTTPAYLLDVSGTARVQNTFLLRGTSGTATITPTSLTADRTYTLPDSTGTVYVASGPDVVVADGGTGASTAANARTNLGLVIGTNVQAFDSDLSDIAALAQSASAVIISNGSNWISQSGAALRSSLGLAIGTNVQAWDAQLDDIAALALSGTTFIVGNGTNYVSHGTAAVKRELDAADKHINITSQNSSTAYTLTITDDHSLIEVGTALGYRIVIPANASVAFPIGTRIGIRQTGVGTVVVGTASGATVNSQGTAYVTNGQYAIAQIFKVGADLWALEGNITT